MFLNIVNPSTVIAVEVGVLKMEVGGLIMEVGGLIMEVGGLIMEVGVRLENVAGWRMEEEGVNSPFSFSKQ